MLVTNPFLMTRMTHKGDSLMENMKKMKTMKTAKTMKTRIALIVLGCLLMAGPVTAAELESHLPAETLVYLQWSGRSLTFDGSKFGQLILDPQMKELMVFFRGLAEENIRDEKGKKVFDKAWGCMRIAWQHPMVAGVYDINKKGASVVVLIDLGEDKAAFEKEFQAILDLMPKRDGEEPAAVQVGEGSYTLLPVPGPLEPACGYLGNVFFFTMGPGQAKALLERKAEASLVTNKNFQERMKAVGGENVQLAIYADIETITKQVEAILPKPKPAVATTTAASQPASTVSGIKDALGVGKLQAVAGTVRVVDKGMYTKFRIFTPAPHRGLLLPLAGATLTEADLVGVPEDVDLAVAANISPKAVYNEVRRALKQIDPHTDRMADGAVAAMEKELEISLEKDLLDALGDTWVFSMAPSQGGPLISSMLSVEVTDAKKLQAFITKMESLLPPPPKAPQTAPRRHRRRRPAARIGKMKVGDTEIRYLRIPGEGPGMAFLPAWAIHKNRLYLALWPQVIASALENDTKPLTAGAAYQTLRKRFSPHGSALVYVNTPEIMKKLYPLQLVGGTLLMNAIAAKTRTEQPIPLWPGSLNGILKYLLPQMNVISHDAQGITFEGYGTTPSILPAMPAVMGMGAFVAIPRMAVARDGAKRVASMTNLRQIGMACQMYAADHDNHLPATLNELPDYFDKNMNVFVSPASGKTPPTWNAKQKKIVGPVDYVLIDHSDVSLSEIASLAQTLLAYEIPANYQNRGTNVGFVDGHVEQVSMPRFRELLKKAQANESKEPLSDF